jgi:tetratricopeptide (TPR) repeat protein
MRFLLPLAIAASAAAIAACNPDAKIQRTAGAAQQHLLDANFAAAEIEAKNLLARQPASPQGLKTIGLIRVRQGANLEGGKLLWQAKRLLPADNELAVNLARAMLAAGFVADSHKELLEILDRSPANAEALTLLVEAATSPEALDECQQRLERVAPGDEPKLLLVAALIDLRRNRTDAARAAVERVVALDPSNSQALALLGNIHRFQQEPDRALPLLRESARLAPPRSLEPLAYAALLADLGNPAQADALLADLTEATPDFLPAWRMRGALAASMHKNQDAERFLARVLSKAPADIEAGLLQAQLWTSGGRPQQAAELLESLKSTYPFRPNINLALARTYVAADDLGRAGALLDEVLAAAPDLGEAVLLRSEVHCAAGRPAEAARLLEALLREHPGHRAAQDRLVAALRAAGADDRALALLDELAATNPNDTNIQIERARVLASRGDLAEARAALDHALQLAPEAFPAVAELAALDQRDARGEAAISRVKDFLAANPRVAQAHLLLAQLCYAAHDLPAAEAAVAVSLNLQPNNPAAHALRVRIQIESGCAEEALISLRERLASAPESLPAWMQLGSLLQDLGRHDEARACFERLTKLQPDFAAAHNNLAFIQAQTPGQLASAADHARKAHALDPANPAISHTLGRVEWQLGNFRDALPLLQQAATGLPENPNVHHDLGLAHAALLELPEAAAAFRQALTLDPKFAAAAEANSHLAALEQSAPFELDRVMRAARQNPADIVLAMRLADCLRAAGQNSEALAAYQAVLALNPNLAAPHLAQAEILAANGEDEKALEAANNARRIAPGSARALAALGQANYRLGRHLQAHSMLAEAAAKLPAEEAVQRDHAWAAYSIGNLAEARSCMTRLAASNSPLAAEARDFLSLTDPTAPLTHNAVLLAKQRLTAKPDHLPALMVQAAQEEKPAAALTYQKVLAAFPEFNPARIALARILLDEPATLGAAEALAKKARQRLEGDPQLAAVLALLSFRKGNFDHAAELLNELARDRKLAAAELFALGMSQARSTTRADARPVLTEALQAGLPAADAAMAQATLEELSAAGANDQE